MFREILSFFGIAWISSLCALELAHVPDTFGNLALYSFLGLTVIFAGSYIWLTFETVFHKIVRVFTARTRKS
jgi:hypothetical protein